MDHCCRWARRRTRWSISCRAGRHCHGGAVFGDVTVSVIVVRSRSVCGGNDDASDDHDPDGDADAETAAQTHTAADGPGSSTTG